MRTLFVLAFLINLALTAGSLLVLPDRVAMRFDSDGLSVGWGSKEEFVLVMLAVETLLFLVILSHPLLVRWLPRSLVNLPSRQYWVQPANWPEAEARLKLLVNEAGTALFIFMGFVVLLTIQANLAKPVQLDIYLFYSSVAALLLYVVWMTIKSIRMFKPPNDESSPNAPPTPK